MDRRRRLTLEWIRKNTVELRRPTFRDLEESGKPFWISPQVLFWRALMERLAMRRN